MENNCSGKQTFLIFYLVRWKVPETWIDSRQSYHPGQSLLFGLQVSNLQNKGISTPSDLSGLL